EIKGRNFSHQDIGKKLNNTGLLILASGQGENLSAGLHMSKKIWGKYSEITYWSEATEITNTLKVIY
ncbi:MAG TPA: hypothetical protein VIH61_00820, partial [Waddliaceae bacterium]